MKLSRKWLNEFVDLSLEEFNDKRFAEAMSVSGSKVEVTEDLSANLQNVKVGRIVKLEKHPNSDHMLVCQLDVGAEAPVQICTGAWNVHEGDLVPAALHHALLPGGVKITKGKLRGVESDGMLCSLKELELTTHDFDYAVIKPAAILGDYHPLDPAKPSISSEIKAGDRIFGKVVAAAVKSGHLSGAAVDVIEEEPMKEGSVLLDAENCIVTPHVAWAPKETRQRLVDVVLSNVFCWLEKEPVNVVEAD